MSSMLQAKVEAQEQNQVLFAKVWQHPYVDLFKQCGVFQGHHLRVQGDVKTVLDPILNKQVMLIKGSISAANFMELPGPGGSKRERDRNPAAAKVTSLGLTGEYMYLQIRPMADRFFSIHIDCMTTQGLNIRLSISNIFKFIKLMNYGRVLQLPCDFLQTKWTVLALHFPSLLEECSRNVASMNAVLSEAPVPQFTYLFHSVTRIQFCSNLYVKNVVTSAHKYSIATFPKECRFFVGKQYSFDDFYEFYWIVTPPSKDEAKKSAEKREDALLDKKMDKVEEEAKNAAALEAVGQSSPVKPFRPSRAAAEASAAAAAASEAGISGRMFDNATSAAHTTSPPRGTHVPVNVLPFVQATMPIGQPIPHEKIEQAIAENQPAPLVMTNSQKLTAAELEDEEYEKGGDANRLGSATTASTAASQEEQESARLKQELQAQSLPATEAESVQDKDTTLPDPLLVLDKIIGFSPSKSSRNLCWSPDSQYMIYPSNNVLVINNVKTGVQEFLQGHTSKIHLVSVASNGLIATGQEGKQAVIRLWDFNKRTCVGILMAHNSDLRCLAFSYLNLMLAAVGRDAQGRLLIVIWDISSLLETGHIHIVAKQLSDFGINRLRFSPYREDPLHLISCGHESIRFWRIKTRHCPGSSLQLNEHSRNTFTDMDFEAKYGEADHTNKRMFVSSASGSVYQISYANRQLECVYKLHSGPIYSLSINEGFCVTGSGDCFLRVWPLDFSDFYLQAQHKGAITSVAISTDGINVLVGAENGCIGILDLGTTSYTTKMRAHLDTIYAVAFDPHRDEFATVSKDGTIRIFGAYSLEQIYEFYSPHEIIHCVAYHPLPTEYRIACGFASGSMRIMDIPTTTMHVDYQQHSGRVLDVLFSPDGMFLYSNGEDGNICAYDCTKNYLPCRMFTTYRNQPVPLPPSVSRTLQQEAERTAVVNRNATRNKEEHEARSPFLSFHLDKARAEEKERENPQNPLPHHSHSHARHCGPGEHGAEGLGGAAAAAAANSPAVQTNGLIPPHALAISDDGNLLATIGADPCSVVLLATDTLRQTKLFTTPNAQPIARLHFAQHDKEIVVVCCDGSYMRFQTETGQMLVHMTSTPAIRYKQEHSRLAKDATSALTALSQPPPISSLCTSSCLSPLNLWLLTGSSECLLRSWDFHSRLNAPMFQNMLAHLNPFTPQEGVTGICFSTDGRKVLSVGGDSVWMWKVQKDEKIGVSELKRRVKMKWAGPEAAAAAQAAQPAFGRSGAFSNALASSRGLEERKSFEASEAAAYDDIPVSGVPMQSASSYVAPLPSTVSSYYVTSSTTTTSSAYPSAPISAWGAAPSSQPIPSSQEASLASQSIASNSAFNQQL